jgi:hypothetical protein
MLRIQSRRYKNHYGNMPVSADCKAIGQYSHHRDMSVAPTVYGDRRCACGDRTTQSAIDRRDVTIFYSDSQRSPPDRRPLTRTRNIADRSPAVLSDRRTVGTTDMFFVVRFLAVFFEKEFVSEWVFFLPPKKMTCAAKKKKKN